MVTTWESGVVAVEAAIVSALEALTWLNGNVIHSFPVSNFGAFPVVFLHIQNDQPDWGSEDTVSSDEQIRHVFTFKLHYENELEDTEDVDNQEGIRLREIGSIVDAISKLTHYVPTWDKLEYSSIQISQEEGIRPNYTLSIMEMDIQAALHINH
jgi:hypothetical protein